MSPDISVGLSADRIAPSAVPPPLWPFASVSSPSLFPPPPQKASSCELPFRRSRILTMTSPATSTSSGPNKIVSRCDLDHWYFAICRDADLVVGFHFCSRMQVMQTKTPMLRTLYTFAARDGKYIKPLSFFSSVVSDSHSTIITTVADHSPLPQIGIPSLWTGLSASILRQSTYSTARFGLYTILSQRLRERNGGNPVSSWTTIGAAAVAGGLAGVIGNPAEVILVRMCADGAKPVGERMNYPDAVRGLVRIAREEGIGTFGRGLAPTVIRSVLMNVGQIAPYVFFFFSI